MKFLLQVVVTLLALQLLKAFKRTTRTSWPTFTIDQIKTNLYPISKKLSDNSFTRLYSYGDPDESIESTRYRKLQKAFRKFYFSQYPNEPDIPGVTFSSPIEWAPWMETIWFGNYYDYRSAFFSDVMYSNNIPNKEGALLFKDSRKALNMA